MGISLYQQIRAAEKLTWRLIGRVKRRCVYEPHTIRCSYPAKRGFIYCPLHIGENLQVALISKTRAQALSDLRVENNSWAAKRLLEKGSR